MRRFFLVLMLSILPLTGCLGMNTGGGTASSVAPQELEGHRWKAVTINGVAVQVYDNQDEPHLVFFDLTGAEARVAGSDGCNRIIGGVHFEGDKVRFGDIGATMMACPAGWEQTQAFKDALAKVDGWNMQGDALVLIEGGNTVLELMPVNLD